MGIMVLHIIYAYIIMRFLLVMGWIMVMIMRPVMVYHHCHGLRMEINDLYRFAIFLSRMDVQQYILQLKVQEMIFLNFL